MRYWLDWVYNALLVPRYRYRDAYSQLCARVTLFLSLLLAFGSAVSLLALLSADVRRDFGSGLFLGATVSLLVQFAIISLVHSGSARTATWLLFAMLVITAAVAAATGVNSSFLLILTIPILYASLIWSWRGTLLATALDCAVVLSVGYLQFQGQIRSLSPMAPERLSLQTGFALICVIGVGATATVFAYELQRSVRHVNRLLMRLNATAEVATQATTTLGDQDQLLKRTVNYIRDRFAFYHAHLFLIDADRRFANLAASTSEIGDILLQRGYRLALGSQSTVGQVMVSGEPIIAAVDENAELLKHGDELTRDVRSELALPLTVGNQIVGVLEIQSARPNAFSQEDVDSLLIMATHVSVAIRNAQVFEEQRSALNENRRLFLDAELNLREIQRLNQRLTGEAWEEYLKGRSTDAVGYTLSNNQLRQDTSWTPMLEQAASRRRPIMMSDGDRQIVAVPVELRGKAIGAIEVEMSNAVRQTDALEMLQSVAQRLALSIDNARLFEQAQELAQQELEVNAISTKIQGVSSMDEIIETAIGELSRALGAQQASIRLKAARRDHNGANGANANSADSGNGNGNGSQGGRP